MDKTAIKRIVLAGVAFTLLPLFGLFGMIKDVDRPQINPKYALAQDGSRDILEDDVWYYYPVTGNYSQNFATHYAYEYAVALKDPKGYLPENETINVDVSFKITVGEGNAITLGGDTDAGIVGIWHNAFQENRATAITLHPGIAVIDFEAFLYSNITSIDIPYTVSTIGDAAFYACSNLKSARIVNSSRGGTDEAITCSCDTVDAGTQSPKDAAFSPISKNVTQATEEINGESTTVYYSDLKIIPSFCFFNCYNMTEFFPNSVIEEIQWEAFNGCSKLNSSLYLRKIKCIRARAFQGCYSIPLVYISSSMFGNIDTGSTGHPINEYGIIEPHAFNYCGDTIHFQFNGIEDGNTNSVTKWLAIGNNSDWGLYTDLGSDSYNNTIKRSITTEEEPTSTSDWEFSTFDTKMGGVSITGYTGRKPIGDWVNGFLMIPENDGQGHDVVQIKKGALNTVESLLYRLYLPKTLKAIDNDFFDKDHFKRLSIIAERSQACDDQNALRDGNGDYDNLRAKDLVRRIDLSKLINLQFIGANAFTGLASFKDLKINTQNKGGKDVYKDTTEVNNTDGQAHGITKIHLPYNLIAVGDEAFSLRTLVPGRGSFRKLKHFIWDYKETVMNEENQVISGSRLETIGKDAFWKFGWDAHVSDNKDHFSAKPAFRDYVPTTLIFPKTFKYFGILNRSKNNDGAESMDDNPTERGKSGGYGPNDVYNYWKDYGFRFAVTNKNNRPAHSFAACPMIEKVIFKGGKADETTDLIIPLQTFAFCTSLQTLVCEERVDHMITFHTQGGSYTQTTCGSNGSKTYTDFRGEPGLETIVLPNKYTTLRIQEMAFHGSSRAAIYLSGERPGAKSQSNVDIDNMVTNLENGKASSNEGQWTAMMADIEGNFQPTGNNRKNDNPDITKIKLWDTIGDESFFKLEGSEQYQGYAGYALLGGNNAFAATKYSDETLYPYGTFCLNQKIPIYEHVHYKEVIKNGSQIVTEVEVGGALDNEAAATRKFTINNNCAYVCEPGYGATMTKFLYDLRAGSGSTARVLDKVKALIPGTSDSYYSGDSTTEYSVKKVGDSAFSAAFCDGTGVTGAGTEATSRTGLDDYDGDDESKKWKTVSGDLNKVELPDSIEEIGDYAFMRAYGVKNIATKHTGSTEYTLHEMPASLKKVGKNAFSFCNIQQFLKIPNDCVFYENTVECQEKENANDLKICSTFSNNLSLRKITFLNSSGNEYDANNKTASKYYETAEYAITEGNTNRYTTALYSKGDPSANETLKYDTNKEFQKKNRLLLVLNRNTAHRSYTDKWNDSSSSTVVTTSSSRTKFDGTIGTSEPFLYGAYRMAFWALDLDTGPATKDEDGNTIPQPLFSSICKRTGNNNSAKVEDSFIYLHISVGDFKGNSCDLQAFTGDIFDQPSYAFRGCENLQLVTLRNRKDGETSELNVVEGLFDDIENSSTQYRAANDSSGVDGRMDLTDTGYNSIGANAFSNNPSITELIAPSTGTNNSTFTIGDNAFSGCTNLAILDFSPMTGTLVLGANAFKGSGVTKIKWPTSGKVVLSAGTFENCTSLLGSTDDLSQSPTELVIPANVGDKADNSADTHSIPSTCFKGCTSLAKVTAEQSNEQGWSHPIESFGSEAFSGCSNLNAFEFDKFSGLTTIGQNAFYDSGSLGGNVDMPSHVTTFRASSFEKSKLTHITFECSSISLGDYAFKDCDSLTGVHFANSSCAWADGNIYHTDVFAECGALSELQLPNSFPLNGSGAFITNCLQSLKIYLHSKSYGTVPNDDFLKVSSQYSSLIPYWLVEDYSDIVTDGSLTVSADKLLWKKGTGCAVPLGKATLENGVVSFDESGWTLNSGGFVDPPSGSVPMMPIGDSFEQSLLIGFYKVKRHGSFASKR